jgi:predicted DNA-binding transcriptional regulator AlpA
VVFFNLTFGGYEEHGLGGSVMSTYMTVTEFAEAARMSRRNLDRIRGKRPPGFPTEYQFARRKINFKRSEVDAWLESRALW